ncbi:hypothetical protein [Caldibacillus thermoamylovorans]|uniref:Uncharacterized protein n=1 Tax=Caldibacillus thermoamylovorans TaxID=35841 RepID=A0ABD4A7T7_9BACI|nr:hypothetical protein [Caldibacillus thermoamylovorans]KIO60634.1 hypothetical protein B4166_3751 [Caldibacillus thermoamylovorans]KIO73049.1 hypothetical protein B4167_2506 [Caldibacillus thermoamylovorans]
MLTSDLNPLHIEGLQLSIRMKMVELGAFEQEGFEKLLREAYERGYLSTMKGLDKAPSFFSVNDKYKKRSRFERI